MLRESVGDALRKAHQWLRLGGTLINLQPHGKPMPVEVRLGPERRAAGSVSDTEEFHENLKLSHRTLTDVAASGLFSLESEISYILEFHFFSREDWTTFLARPQARSVEADEDLLEEALSRDDGSIVVAADTFAWAYARTSG